MLSMVLGFPPELHSHSRTTSYSVSNPIHPHKQADVVCSFANMIGVVWGIFLSIVVARG